MKKRGIAPVVIIIGLVVLISAGVVIVLVSNSSDKIKNQGDCTGNYTLNCTDINQTNCTCVKINMPKEGSSIFCDASEIKKFKYDEVIKTTWKDPKSESTCTIPRYFKYTSDKIYYLEDFSTCSTDTIKSWTIYIMGSANSQISSLGTDGCTRVQGSSVKPRTKTYYQEDFTGETKEVLDYIGYKLKTPEVVNYAGGITNVMDYINREYCYPLEQVSDSPVVKYEMQRTNFGTNFSDGVFTTC